MATIRYDQKVDIMTIDTAPNIRIAVSSGVANGLVADYGREDGFDVVGIELWAAGKHLVPFCVLSEADAIQSRKAVAKFKVKTDYDQASDILTVKTSYAIADCQNAGDDIIAYFGYCDVSCQPCPECYDFVGFELHNAAGHLAPWFKLNRASLHSTPSAPGHSERNEESHPKRQGPSLRSG